MASNYENMQALQKVIATHKQRKAMQQSKFKPGDRVRVVGYGHLTEYGKKGYQAMMEYLTDHPGPGFLDLLMGTADDYKDPPPKLVHEVYRPAHVLRETDISYIADMSPELVGQVGTIKGSYDYLYGGSGEDRFHSYSLNGIAGKCAWYDEAQLELVS